MLAHILQSFEEKTNLIHFYFKNASFRHVCNITGFSPDSSPYQFSVSKNSKIHNWIQLWVCSSLSCGFCSWTAPGPTLQKGLHDIISGGYLASSYIEIIEKSGQLCWFGLVSFTPPLRRTMSQLFNSIQFFNSDCSKFFNKSLQRICLWKLNFWVRSNIFYVLRLLGNVFYCILGPNKVCVFF